MEANANRLAFKSLIYNPRQRRTNFKVKNTRLFSFPYSMKRFMEPQSIMY